MVDLRLDVMRADLERVGVWNPVRARERFLAAFVAAHTWVVDVPASAARDGRNAGLIAVRPEPDALWIEHFYLRRDLQGAGLGGAVLAKVMARHAGTLPFWLNVLRGSAARRLYERHGFGFGYEDAVDVYLTAPAAVAGATSAAPPSVTR